MKTIEWNVVGILCLAALLLPAATVAGQDGDDDRERAGLVERDEFEWAVERPLMQSGPRPFFLVDDMDASPLKTKLSRCDDWIPRRTDFSIGHRGAPLMFPEHTKESYEAAARMGAGILECDVSFTSDAELVCRHSQCDLHTTTNILEIPELARQCSVPFSPAQFDAEGRLVKAASAKCCTSDLTVEQFKQLQGKMDAFNPRATTVPEYLRGTANGQSDLYSSRGTVMTHAESIELFRSLGAKFIPELKGVDAKIGFGNSGLTQERYAQKLIDEYRAAGIPARHVWPQSFNLDDVLYWIEHEPRYGRQALYLDGRYGDPAFAHDDPSTWRPGMAELERMGVRLIGPPMWMLLENRDGRMSPSVYARAAKRAGLDIVTWTLERSGPLSGGGGWYYQTVSDVVDNDGDMLVALDVLARRVGVLGVFSDWPATTTFYANCMGLR